ncbi:MAG: helix-turn-helix transcriptional regulator [Flavobacteriaceae bacterium]|nr:helix-turn-helix transcriptional regulator [Flavobacteriaceae bacterium]
MKVLPFKIPKPEKTAIIYQEDIGISFYDKLHQHEEIQISLILEGEGTLIVGDTVNYYKKDDILVIGGNIPHVFKSNTETSTKSHMLSVFFKYSSFGDGFFRLEDLNELDVFFNKAKKGFKIIPSKSEASRLFLKLHSASRIERLIILLQLLKISAKSDYRSLSSFIYDKTYNEIEGKRMQDVFEFTMRHYTEKITLEKIANVANLTKNAFCKYFKKRTNKTYVRFLNELRIEHSCRLIYSDPELPMTEIAYRSGYNNISNFNKQFKAIKKLRPSALKNF